MAKSKSSKDVLRSTPIGRSFKGQDMGLWLSVEEIKQMEEFADLDDSSIEALREFIFEISDISLSIVLKQKNKQRVTQE